ncbi:M56 family metallopeptidase [Myxococcus landrumensis]|uniref:M56 family metallopeptidase n=1 Tax=Myxococcus landrumensis TaxID=2813577 RepID=A0ABX7N253_9BACT|nr:M56 family metallopeptidase [Myxococcus landrumus]QSQ11782.1 M56 family metallopeptidase [Myxococcus landrumus]
MSGLVMESLGWALLHSLWQGTLVALGLAAALLMVGARAANTRYALACGALMLAVVMPVVTGVRHATQARAERRLEQSSPMHGRRSTPEGFARWTPREESRPGFLLELSEPKAQAWWAPMVERARASLAGLLRWLVLAWVAGVGLTSGRLTAQWVQLRQLARRALPAPQEWQERLDALSQRLGLKRAVRLLQTTEVDVPSTVGWLSPVVLLPVSALSGLPTRQLEMVLAHELAHIRRHDFAVNLAQVVVETLFFYHPAVHWMSERIRVEREHCCDDVAVSASGNSLSYARALTALETLRVQPELLHAMSALGGSLPDRVRRLVSPPASRCSSRWVAGASVLTLVSSLAIAAPLTSLVLGQSPEPTSTAAMPPPPESPEPPAFVAPTAPVAPPGVPRPMTPPPGFRVAAAPQPQVKLAMRGPDEKREDKTRVGSGQPLTVDQLVELKLAGVTPEKVRELESLGYEATVSDVVELGHTGVTLEYLKQMNAAFGRKLAADMLVELRAVGVTPEYVRALRESGFATKDPDEVVQARAVGVTEQYVRELGAAGYSNLSLEDLSHLRAVGVDPDFIRGMSRLGLPKLSSQNLQHLRAVGVTPEWLSQMRAAGLEMKDPDELVELRALNVSPEFIRELNDAGLKNLSSRELVRLRSGGVDAEFIRRMRDTKKP